MSIIASVSFIAIDFNGCIHTLVWEELKFKSILINRNPYNVSSKFQFYQSMLTLFDMGGGRWPPKMFLTTVPKRVGGGS